MSSQPPHAPEIRFSDAPVAYEDAVAFMETRVQEIIAGRARECIWFLEHPPLYTAGTSAKPADLVQPDRFPVYASQRGGEYTYHGPGQRVVYLMLDLRTRGRDVRCFVRQAEDWVIRTLDDFNIQAHITPGRVGVWVSDPSRDADKENKIAAVGMRIRRWVSFHGISINVEPDLSHFDGIVPCGIRDQGVTSMVELGLPVTLAELDKALLDNFETAFAPPKTAE
ncbi:MAG: lipoyl(octanoyl) transferase LipB [Rhodobiaceae bacterium]|jgi:lipoyl(octanoyl) transferase|nr:lipoyl(octanoyl) transferase LipB [Rhodobiaceae bacterium]MBT5518400.1 lipoyl(octanoyl) transferase LipB [Rhodobiaceae bacterium]MBT7279324.1 lipoyl(octanoyl) transferase LipB [Rhodobiaceae bacterium]MDG2496269.1 lipoyl(octanoyl) transferase LipB [Alphaproteobacteria bacterium]